MKLLIITSLFMLHHLTASASPRAAGKAPSRVQVQHPLLFTQPSNPAPKLNQPALKVPGHSPFSHCAGHDPTHDLLSITQLDYDFTPMTIDDEDAEPGASRTKHGYATTLTLNGTISPHADIMHNGIHTTAQIEIQRDGAAPQLLRYNNVALVALQDHSPKRLYAANPPQAGAVVLERHDWWDEKMARDGRYHVRVVSTTVRGQMLFCIEGEVALHVDASLSRRGVPLCEQR